MASNPALAPDGGPPVVPLGAACALLSHHCRPRPMPWTMTSLRRPTTNNNPAISSLVFLPWGQPSAAGTVRIHRALFQSALLPGCRTDPTSPADKAALGSANILEQELSAAKTSELSFAWYQASLFNSPILSVGQLGESMVNLTSHSSLDFPRRKAVRRKMVRRKMVRRKRKSFLGRTRRRRNLRQAVMMPRREVGAGAEEACQVAARECSA
eukprot:scaffold3944_cov111-Isochrysis_galbana.AAC.5